MIVLNKNFFINTDKLYISVSAVIILFTSWTIFYHLPFDYVFILILSIWTIFKNSLYSFNKLKLFFGSFIISIWFYTPHIIGFKNSLIGIFSAFCLSIFFLIDHKIVTKILDTLFEILSVIVGIGLLLHLLFFFNYIDLPQFAEVRTGDDRSYSIFPMLVYESLPSGLLVNFRFNSIFDEPGYLGTIVVLFLINQDFNFKKPSNIILFLGGLFTLSFAFYLLSIPFLLLKILRRFNLFDFIFICLVIPILFILFSDLGELFLMRQEFSSSEFSSSRGDFDVTLENINFLKSQDYFSILFGNGFDAHLHLYNGYSDEGVANSTIFRLFYQIGIFGVLYFIVFLFYNINVDRKSIFFLIAFILSMYQRPQIFEPIFFLLIASNFKPEKNLTGISNLKSSKFKVIE